MARAIRPDDLSVTGTAGDGRVEIVGPPEVRDHLARIGRELAALYDDATAAGRTAHPARSAR